MSTILRSYLNKRPTFVRAVGKADTLANMVFSALPRLELAVFIAFIVGGTLAGVMIRQ